MNFKSSLKILTLMLLSQHVFGSQSGCQELCEAQRTESRTTSAQIASTYHIVGEGDYTDAEDSDDDNTSSRSPLILATAPTVTNSPSVSGTNSNSDDEKSPSHSPTPSRAPTASNSPEYGSGSPFIQTSCLTNATGSPLLLSSSRDTSPGTDSRKPTLPTENAKRRQKLSMKRSHSERSFSGGSLDDFRLDAETLRNEKHSPQTFNRISGPENTNPSSSTSMQRTTGTPLFGNSSFPLDCMEPSTRKAVFDDLNKKRDDSRNQLINFFLESLEAGYVDWHDDLPEIVKEQVFEEITKGVQPQKKVEFLIRHYKSFHSVIFSKKIDQDVRKAVFIKLSDEIKIEPKTKTKTVPESARLVIDLLKKEYRSLQDTTFLDSFPWPRASTAIEELGKNSESKKHLHDYFMKLYETGDVSLLAYFPHSLAEEIIKDLSSTKKSQNNLESLCIAKHEKDKYWIPKLPTDLQKKLLDKITTGYTNALHMIQSQHFF